MNVFIFWEGKMPFYIQKCIDKMKDAFKDKLIIVNYKNIGKYIPTLPTHLRKIRELALQVDYIRVALLYHNSGVYLDADCIVFPIMLPYLEDIFSKHKDKELIGLGRNNIIDANAFFVAPNKKSFVLKKILEEQEKIIGGKRGRLYWSEIGGNLIKQVASEYKDKCLTLNPSPIYFSGWKNTDIFATTDKEKILEFVDKIVLKKLKGIMLYNKVMKNLYMNHIEEGTLLSYFLIK